MTINTFYSCDICCEGHDTEDEALACERSHVMPIGIGWAKYYDHESKYPEQIEIHFNDGMKLIYRPIGEVIKDGQNN